MADSRLTRTKMVISLDRDIGSFVSLVDLFQPNSRENMVLLVKKMTGVLASLKAFSDENHQYDDADYITILTENMKSLDTHLNNYYIIRHNPDANTARHTIFLCSEFKNHLDALRLLYDACIPQLMQDILTSMEKIQKKLGDP